MYQLWIGFHTVSISLQALSITSMNLTQAPITYDRYISRAWINNKVVRDCIA